MAFVARDEVPSFQFELLALACAVFVFGSSTRAFAVDAPNASVTPRVSERIPYCRVFIRSPSWIARWIAMTRRARFGRG
jgi:hypothetical protein